MIACGAFPELPLESRNHLILEDEPAFPRFIEEIKSFVNTPR